jgi:hypothetical protein
VRKERTVLFHVPVLVTESSFYADGLPDEIIKTRYDDSLLRALEMTTYDAARPDPIERVVYEWKDGLLAAETVYESDGKVKLRRERSYDAQGRLVGDRVLDAKSQPQSSSSFAFDADGNKAEWLYFDAKGVIKVLTLYSYDKGKLAFVELKDPSGRTTLTNRLEYGDDGALAKRSYFAADGSLLKSENYVYAAGVLASVEYLRADGSLSSKTVFEMGELGRALKATDYDGSGATRESRSFEYLLREDSKIETYYE